MICATLRYAPEVYRDEIKTLENMPVYFAPFPAMVGLQVHEKFENES